MDSIGGCASGTRCKCSRALIAVPFFVSVFRNCSFVSRGRDQSREAAPVRFPRQSSLAPNRRRLIFWKNIPQAIHRSQILISLQTSIRWIPCFARVRTSREPGEESPEPPLPQSSRAPLSFVSVVFARALQRGRAESGCAARPPQISRVFCTKLGQRLEPVLGRFSDLVLPNRFRLFAASSGKNP